MPVGANPAPDEPVSDFDELHAATDRTRTVLRRTFGSAIWDPRILSALRFFGFIVTRFEEDLMRRTALYILAAACALPAVISAQQKPTAATYITDEDVKTVNATPGVDRTIRVVDIGNENFAVGVIHRAAPAARGTGAGGGAAAGGAGRGAAGGGAGRAGGGGAAGGGAGRAGGAVPTACG